MITYYSVLLILATVGVRCQHVLKEYAPNHDNYESYSFAYGVSDPISGDHKHQWERMQHGQVQGEYGLMEPDGMMRLVQYTAGPKDGFHATVKKLAVRVAQPEFTQGRNLYQQDGEYDGARYAADDISGLTGINQNTEDIIGNAQPEYVQLDYGHKINQENKTENDYANQESQQHTIITRSTAENRNNTQIRRKKDQSSSNSRRKQIVKKNIETELHLLQPGYTAGGTEYITNFNMNPLNIEQLNIPDREKNLLRELSAIQAQPLTQENHQHRIISASVHNPRPFTIQGVQNTAINNLNTVVHPALIKFQKEIGNSQFHGYHITPHQQTLPLVQSSPQIQTLHQSLPTSIQDVKAQQGIDSSYNDKRFQNALALIHNHPVIKTRLENFHNLHNIPQEQPRIQIPYEQQHYQQQDPSTINGHYQNGYSQIQQKPIQGSSDYEPNLEGKRYNNENQTAEEKEEERQYLLGLRPLNIPQNHNQQYIQNSEVYSNQNIPQQSYQTNGNQNYAHYQQRHPDISYERTQLSSQNHYPIILVDPKAKLGLPFYPSSKEIHQIPYQEYNYEGIPLYGPNLEGKRYNTENQTDEEKAQERQYLLGIKPSNLFPPPPGYTRETIWQAGDSDADPEPEILVRQLNETCAYIQLNETTPGTEDGRLNIWQAGDYSAQRQEEELIRSINITCENYTADAMSNFSSGYTVVDYCWQCVRIDGSEYEDGQNQPYLPNNEQQQQDYIQNDGNNEQQQIAYVQSEENNRQQEVAYVQNNEQNKQQQIVYVQNDGNTGQNQGNYETSVEKYAQHQDVNNAPQTYNGHSQVGRNEYQQGEGPMKMVIYPNYGYRNDPQRGEYGLNRRRRTNKQKAERISDNTKS